METLQEDTRDYHENLRIIFSTVERSLALKTSKQLKLLVANTHETFETIGMEVYKNKALALCIKEDWHAEEKTLAECIYLYHYYLMFYTKISSPACNDFLSRIMFRYQWAVRKTQ